MKSSIKVIVGLFLMMVIVSMSVHVVKAGEKDVEMFVEQEMSLLDRIVEQACIVVDFKDQKARFGAKKELTKLMKKKELNKTIKAAIKDDVEVIKNSKTKRELYAARHRLIIIANEIRAKADVIVATAEATEMVQNALPEDLEKTIAQAKKKIEEAEKAEQGMMTRLYVRAKRMVTDPVDYVFGEESSMAKTAFYAAVGLAASAAVVYSAYQYGVGSPTEMPKVSPVADWRVLEKKKIELDNKLTTFFLKKDLAAEHGKGEQLTPEENAQLDALFAQAKKLESEQAQIEEILYKKGIVFKSADINKLRVEVRDEFKVAQNASPSVSDTKKMSEEFKDDKVHIVDEGNVGDNEVVSEAKLTEKNSDKELKIDAGKEDNQQAIEAFREVQRQRQIAQNAVNSLTEAFIVHEGPLAPEEQNTLNESRDKLDRLKMEATKMGQDLMKAHIIDKEEVHKIINEVESDLR
jgi:hypothetical protein